MGLGGGRAAGGGATRAAAEGLLEGENCKVFICFEGELIYRHGTLVNGGPFE